MATKTKKKVVEKQVDLTTTQNFQFVEQVYKDHFGERFVITGKPATKKALTAARKKANKILKSEGGIDKLTFRSCWLCNGAHERFLGEKWGDWVMNCFACGRFYFDGMDITLYEKPKKK